MFLIPLLSEPLCRLHRHLLQLLLAAVAMRRILVLCFVEELVLV